MRASVWEPPAITVRLLFLGGRPLGWLADVVGLGLSWRHPRPAAHAWVRVAPRLGAALNGAVLLGWVGLTPRSGSAERGPECANLPSRPAIPAPIAPVVALSRGGRVRPDHERRSPPAHAHELDLDDLAAVLGNARKT